MAATRPKPTVRSHAVSQRALTLAPKPLVVAETGWTPSEEGDLVPYARPEPYQDYARRFTAEGGIEIRYKDIDDRFILKLGRFMAWAFATWMAGLYIFNHPLFYDDGSNVLALLVAAIANYFIFRGPTEVFRCIEVRPDCMILDGEDVFWASWMELGPPSLVWKDEIATLTGVYGNRWVEYLTIRRFDELDRSPEILEAQLASAFEMLWSKGKKAKH